MSKSHSTKSKPPWIPAGKLQPQHKRGKKPGTIVKSKKDDRIPAEVTFTVLPEWDTVDISIKGANQELDADDMNVTSSSSHSSYEFERQERVLDINHASLLKEMTLFYKHFEAIKASYLSAQRLISYQDIVDRNATDIFIEVGTFLKTLNALFEDLEYQISVFENTLNENQRKIEFATALKNKEKLVSTLLAMYEKVILIFQIVFEKQNFKELLEAEESLRGKLKILEKRCLSQAAISTDLERKISIYQSEIATMESYKTNLEKEKAELEKNLLAKESEIKCLKNLVKAPSEKSRHEEYIELIAQLKTEADYDKLRIKNAIKYYKECTEKERKEADENYNKLLKEKIEKERMMLDLATQRDELKVQLTVVSNTVVQLRHQVEEMKILNLKLHNEVIEIESSHKKEVTKLKSTIEEKSFELDESLKRKKRLEEKITELENEMEKSKSYYKAPNGESVIPELSKKNAVKKTDMQEEVPRLIAVLQSTRETFEKLIHSDHYISDSGDHLTINTEFGNNQNEILALVHEIKQYILDLKNQSLFLDEKDMTDPMSPLMKKDLEKQLKKTEHLYKIAVKENESLKQKLEDLRNLNLATSSTQNNDDYSSADKSRDNKVRNLQLEIYKKDKEIANLKYDLAKQEKDLANNLKESKEKLRNLEMQNAKIEELEKELKNTKYELSFVQRKKEEETASLLQRVQELQESLDNKSAQCKNLEEHIQRLKTHYYRVFESS